MPVQVQLVSRRRVLFDLRVSATDQKYWPAFNIHLKTAPCSWRSWSQSKRFKKILRVPPKLIKTDHLSSHTQAISGGPERFGFPDDGYCQRVLEDFGAVQTSWSLGSFECKKDPNGRWWTETGKNWRAEVWQDYDIILWFWYMVTFDILCLCTITINFLI